MTSESTASRGFRRGLAHALPGWIDEGLVSPEAADTLRARYALDEAAGSMQRLLLICIYMVGATLIGGGAITFVAANWSLIPQAGQAGLLIGAMLACHLAGYHIGYQRQTHPGLGHALIVVGTLIFGASIPLFAQIFELEGHWTGGVTLWAVGAAAMAAATGSVPLALAAITAAVVAQGGATTGRVDTSLWMAPLIAAGGLSFGRLAGSRAVTVFAVVGAGAALLFHAGDTHGFHGVVLAAMVTGLLLTTAGLLTRWPEGARTVGIGTTLFFAYLVSYEEPAKSVFRNDAWQLTPPFPEPMLALVLAAMVAGAAVLWARAFRAGELDAGKLDARPQVMVAGLFAAAAILLSLMVLVTDAAALVLIANASLLALGAGLIGAGVRTAHRGAFWTGMIVIGAVIIGRFFEIDTSLLAKSAVFIACGVAVLVAGIRFEGALRRREIVS